MNFKAGDKLRLLFNVNGLEKGQIVTIKEVRENGCRSHNPPNNEPKISLKEKFIFNNPCCWHYKEGFAFEKIPDKITDWREEFKNE
jgi:hypothetical protein